MASVMRAGVVRGHRVLVRQPLRLEPLEPRVLLTVLTDFAGQARGPQNTLDGRAPTLVLTGPAANLAILQGETVTVQWTDADSDDNALVSTAIDPDDVAEPWTDADHTWMVQNLPEDPDGPNDQIAWSVKGLAPGTYTIWGVIDDGTNPPVYSRAPGRITVHGILLDTRVSGGTRVLIYDMATPGDVNPADIAVRFGAGDAVRSITLGGTQAMDGLGIAW